MAENESSLQAKDVFWTDYPGGSVRSDGAKAGEFIIDGRFEWWGYPPHSRPRGEVDAIGPFATRDEAKDALTSCLSIP
jgi:hypothetical protein